MVDPTALGSFTGLFGEASDYYEFWKEYKGEEILIRDHSMSVGGASETNGRGKISQNIHVIRGTVDDVTSFPPGFLLKDVEEYIELSDVHLMFSVGSTSPVDAAPGNHGKQVLREVDEKYVSFSSINQVERADAADSSVEPFRQSQEDE